MKKLIFSTAFAALLSSSAVFAGGPDMMIMPPSPFNGFYIGGSGSFHHTGFENDSNLNLVNNGFFFTPFNVTLASQNGGDTSTDGYYGVRGGWGKVFMNRWYAGVEGFADFGNADGSTSTTLLPTVANGLTITNSDHVGTDWGVAARLGMLLSPTTLAYAKLGAEWADVESSVSSNLFGNTLFLNSSDSNNESGFLWGFGLEQFIWKNMVSLFAEYTYVSLGSVSSTASFNLVNPADGFFGFTATNTVTADISSFTGGLNFHFGEDWI